MKIIDAKLAKSKSQQMREIIKQITGQKEKAAFFESENDFRMFCKIARSENLKPKSKKAKSGGWQVWCCK